MLQKIIAFEMHHADSANNAVERMREAVIHRNVRGLLRNGKGMRMFGNIMAAVMTCKLRWLNMMERI